MIICICHGVNSKRLQQLAQDGITSVRQLQEACQAGTTCGACIPELKKACACRGAEDFAQDPVEA